HCLESEIDQEIRHSSFAYHYVGDSQFEIGDRTDYFYNIIKQYELGVYPSQRHVEIVKASVNHALIGDRKYFISSIGFFHILELRDSMVVPTRGLVVNQTFELATSALGSDIELFRTTARASFLLQTGISLLELVGL